MKKLIAICICLNLFFGLGLVSVAQAAEKGGCYPMFASCCLGARIGLELNEGVEVRDYEWLNLIHIGKLIGAIKDSKKNGAAGFFASCCIGARIGGELDKRKIRTFEWLGLIPIVNIYPAIVTAIDAYDGVTMSEIANKEKLKK